MFIQNNIRNVCSAFISVFALKNMSYPSTKKVFAKGKQDEWNGMGSQNLISVEFLTQVSSFNTFTSGPLSVGILITRTYHQHNILLNRTVCYAQ
jgi:hypothetical protein